MLPAIEESQAELLRRIAAQDREALGEFYDQTANPLYSVAFAGFSAMWKKPRKWIQDVFVLIWTKAAEMRCRQEMLQGFPLGVVPYPPSLH